MNATFVPRPHPDIEEPLARARAGAATCRSRRELGPGERGRRRSRYFASGIAPCIRAFEANESFDREPPARPH